MRMRLYGGAGHGRMVYIPGSTVTAPPEISMPVLTPREFELLWPLDPELPETAAIRYRDSGHTEPDGYRRYDWVPS